MIISILTLFPEIFQEILSFSILGRAQKNALVTFNLIDIRKFAADKHGTVDDKPYGGGVGMILKVDVVEKAINYAKTKYSLINTKNKIVLLDPKARLFTQKKAVEYSQLNHLTLVCGHYEGIDERIAKFVDERISIGRYILTGGEIPAMVIADATVRLISGVLKKEATHNESYSTGTTIEYPQYTRPVTYKGLAVPKILLSGNHRLISMWKNKKLLRRHK